MRQPPRAILGKNINRLRTQRALTQDDLAGLAEIDRRYVQRIEAGRGPNAILYGEGGPGGGVNYITKQAEHRRFTTVRLRGDTLGSKGLAIDFNRPLTDKLDVQLNVDNVLNYDAPMINGMFIYGDRLVPYGFRRMNPPELRFTSTLKL